MVVEMSGLPVFDRERQFKGFRGFGICRDVGAEPQHGVDQAFRSPLRRKRIRQPWFFRSPSSLVHRSRNSMHASTVHSGTGPRTQRTR